MGLSMFQYRLYGSQGKPINETDALGPRLTLFSHTAIVSADHLETRSIIQIISDHKDGKRIASETCFYPPIDRTQNTL